MSDLLAKFGDLLFPACAGVIRLFTGNLQKTFAVPRVCGGDPEVDMIIWKLTRCSPRVRG